jgi:hypothetical protein
MGLLGLGERQQRHLHCGLGSRSWNLSAYRSQWTLDKVPALNGIKIDLDNNAREGFISLTAEEKL